MDLQARRNPCLYCSILTMLKSAVLLALASSVNSECLNQCSGHGTCTIDDVCECFDNWGLGIEMSSGDCSQRECFYERAWVDQPNFDGRVHKYAECAGKGLCDRDTGLCDCFEGYEGHACQRRTCPNDCSGHGRCEFVEDLGDTILGDNSNMGSYPVTVPYYDWDKTRTRVCVCDATYTEEDCSKRMCPHGTDVLDVRDNLLVAELKHKQYITLIEDDDTFADTDLQTFALTFKSRINETYTTYPISFDKTSLADKVDLRDDIHLALLSLPNRVIDECVVNVYSKIVHDGAVDTEVRQTDIEIIFTGDAVQGPQNLIMVEDILCEEGCSPRLTGLKLQHKVNYFQSNITVTQDPDLNSYECGRRGKCDYETGLCQCYLGYTGENCNIQTDLA